MWGGFCLLFSKAAREVVSFSLHFSLPSIQRKRKTVFSTSTPFKAILKYYFKWKRGFLPRFDIFNLFWLPFQKGRKDFQTTRPDIFTHVHPAPPADIWEIPQWYRGFPFKEIPPYTGRLNKDDLCIKTGKGYVLKGKGCVLMQEGYVLISHQWIRRIAPSFVWQWQPTWVGTTNIWMHQWNWLTPWPGAKMVTCRPF